MASGKNLGLIGTTVKDDGLFFLGKYQVIYMKVAIINDFCDSDRTRKESVKKIR